MKRKTIILLILSFLFTFSPSSFPHANNNLSDAKERIIITFENEINEQLISDYEIDIHHYFPQYNSVSATVDKRTKEALLKNNTVLFIEEDPIVVTEMQTVNWGIKTVKALDAHKSGYTGKGVKIGVLDSGVYIDHPDLKVAGGVSFIGPKTNYNDEDGHGTHVTGIISALDNDIGTVGVAPDADVYAIKVIGADGTGNHSDVVKGIEWALKNDLHIINLSITTEQKSFILERSVNDAYERGLLIVAAAGNSLTPLISPVDVLYPAKHQSVIAVGSVNELNKKSRFSYFGNSLEFVAPGENILSTYIPVNNSLYARAGGTSMATPFVTGVAALYKEANPMLTNKQLRTLLRANTIDLGPVGKDPHYGYGLIQAPIKETTTFPDVVAGSWYEEAVKKLSNEKIINGFSDGYFYPYKKVTRAQAVTMIGKALNLDGAKQQTIYKDVSKSHYASGFIKSATDKQIVTGYPNNKFGPNDYLTRGAAAVILVRAFNIKATPTAAFTDVKKDRYYTEAVEILRGADITTGYTDGTFRPNEKISRAEFATLLLRATKNK